MCTCVHPVSKIMTLSRNIYQASPCEELPAPRRSHVTRTSYVTRRSYITRRSYMETPDSVNWLTGWAHKIIMFILFFLDKQDRNHFLPGFSLWFSYFLFHFEVLSCHVTYFAFISSLCLFPRLYHIALFLICTLFFDSSCVVFCLFVATFLDLLHLNLSLYVTCQPVCWCLSPLCLTVTRSVQ